VYENPVLQIQPHMPMTRDKQLSGIKLKAVLQKQRLGQALNVKEFAVLAGISYSTAREWFHTRGFPALAGRVFWQDFVTWRRRQTGIEAPFHSQNDVESAPPPSKDSTFQLPEKARNLLAQA
jgi:hypothetical protein